MLESFVSKTRRLVDLERDAEIAQAQQAMQSATEESRSVSPVYLQLRIFVPGQLSGTTLFNLRCTEVEGGLMGRHLLTLMRNIPSSKSMPSPDLPPHKFSPHDIVELRSSKGGLGPVWASGVIYRVKESAVIVAVDDLPENEGLDQIFRIDKLANEVTYNRLCLTLDLLSNTGNQDNFPGTKLFNIAFQKTSPSFSNFNNVSFFNQNLDTSQREAVMLSLRVNDLAMIHGPPGTGKTTTVVEVIVQEVNRGNRVLACAASNIAVDNIVDRLSSLKYFKNKVVRFGHPARLLPEVLKNCLESHVNKSDNSSLAKDIRKEMKTLTTQLMKLESWKKAEKSQIRRELRRLSKEEKQRQEKAVSEVLSQASVLCSTLSGVHSHHLKNLEFDIVVIDEAAQALEVACWGALLKSKKAILAGDHLQLPPTILSKEASQKGLDRTLFERLHKDFGDVASVMLTEQYRMNAQIMNWSSKELYNSKLIAHSSVADHTLNDLDGVKPLRDDSGVIPVCLFVDTAGCDCSEVIGDDGISKANPEEAKAVMKHINELILIGVKPDNIGIITPYNGQVACLRDLRKESHRKVEISSVDGFQGREKEAIIISTVRSNDEEEVGFLNDKRRMNVAVTRARRHCAIFGDSGTLSSDPFLERLVQYFEENGDYRSFEEFMQ